MRVPRLDRADGLGGLGPVIRALLVFVALADGVLSLELWSLRHHTARAATTAVLSVVAPVRPLAAMALAAAALYLATRPKRQFHRILLVLAAAAAVLAVESQQRALITVALVDGLVALLGESLWPERADPLSSRLGWSLLGVAAALTVISGWIFLAQHRAPHEAPLFTLPLVLAFAAVVSAVALLDRNPALPTHRDPRPPHLLYRAAARSGVAPFALMLDKRRFWADDGGSFLAYGCRTGVALALGPAIGEPGSAAGVYDQFRSACRLRGWRPAFYQVPQETIAGMRGVRQVMIGSEAMVDLDRFRLEGRAMANVRHQVTKARRLGVSVEVLPESRVPWDVLSAMRRLAQDLARRSRLGEMTFSVGRWGDPADVERTAGIAFHGDRNVAAYVTWLWLPAAETVVLDEVRRSPDAPAGAVELLMVTCLEQFRDRARLASLGLAPITGAGQAARLVVVEGFLRRTLGLRGVSAGLYAFKAKFNPTWEPRYLGVERLVDLLPVLLATLLLHYPQLGHRHRTGAASPRHV